MATKKSKAEKEVKSKLSIEERIAVQVEKTLDHQLEYLFEDIDLIDDELREEIEDMIHDAMRAKVLPQVKAAIEKMDTKELVAKKISEVLRNL